MPQVLRRQQCRMSSTPTSVYVVDDSELIRRRVVSMLAAMNNVSVVGEASGAQEAIEGILDCRPDFVLLDLDLGTSSGMDVLQARAPMPCF